MGGLLRAAINNQMRDGVGGTYNLPVGSILYGI